MRSVAAKLATSCPSNSSQNPGNRSSDLKVKDLTILSILRKKVESCFTKHLEYHILYVLVAGPLTSPNATYLTSEVLGVNKNEQESGRDLKLVGKKCTT